MVHWVPPPLSLTIYFEPIRITAKTDGQPAVEIENDGKKQQFVSLL